MKPRMWLVVVAMLVSLCACGGSSKRLDAPPLMTVVVRPDPSANDGRSFYLIVKEVDEAQFARDTYEKIEAIVPQDNRDPDVIGVYAVSPGTDLRLTMRRPSYRPAGFYLLLTQPEDTWKVLLPMPVGKRYNLWVGKDRASITRRMSTW